jgi:hypothetical protein
MGTRATEMSISDLFQHKNITVVRMTHHELPKACLDDIVIGVTGNSRHTSSAAVRNIIQKNPERWGGLAKYQFPGSGQTPREVVSAKEAFEFLMELRGKAADKIRLEFSVLLTRLYAGDPALKDLIDQNGLSDGVIHQFARAGMGGDKAAVGQADKVDTLTDEETQLTKKIHLATMRQQLDDIERKRTVSQFEHVDWISKQCVMGAPESQRMWMEESNRNYKISVFNTAIGGSIGGGSPAIENGPMYTDEMETVTISVHIIQAKGLKDPDNKMAMRIGTIAAAMYCDWNEGRKPPKERAIIKGYPVQVNKYFKKDMPLLEAAFREFEASDVERTRKSDLLANQPSIRDYWNH